MKKIAILTLLIFNHFIGLSQTKNFIDMPFIEVMGQADTLVTPNEIYLKILLSEKDSKNKVSIEAQEISLVEVCKKNGVNTDKNLTASDLTSNFKFHFLKYKDILKTKEYILKVTTATLATQILIDLEKVDISNTSIDRVDHSEKAQLTMTMRSFATKNAKDKAEALLKPLGQQVGQALYISERSDNSITNQNYLQGSVAGIVIRGNSSLKEFSKQPKIEFEKIKIEVLLDTKFELLN